MMNIFSNHRCQPKLFGFANFQKPAGQPVISGEKWKIPEPCLPTTISIFLFFLRVSKQTVPNWWNSNIRKPTVPATTTTRNYWKNVNNASKPKRVRFILISISAIGSK